MPDNEKMLRVSRENSCPVCDKPDWCLVAEDGSAAICARIEEGSVKKCGDAGWLHVLRNNGHNGHRRSASKRQVLKSFPLNRCQARDFSMLAEQYQQQLTQRQLEGLSGSLGVSSQSLRRLGMGWDGRAFTFPMSNDFGKIIGIRRRFPNGRKVSMTGSRTGLFVPEGLPESGLLLICEGATDTAAALDLDFAALGRPSCNSRVDMTARFVKGRKVVIVGDNDKVGKVGAEKLASALILYCWSVKLIFPSDGTKDLRRWLQTGLTQEKLQQIIDKKEELQIKISFKD